MPIAKLNHEEQIYFRVTNEDPIESRVYGTTIKPDTIQLLINNGELLHANISGPLVKANGDVGVRTATHMYVESTYSPLFLRELLDTLGLIFHGDRVNNDVDDEV